MIGCSSRNGSGSCLRPCGPAAGESSAAESSRGTGRFRRLFPGLRSSASSSGEQPLQHARAFDAAGGQHRLGPLLRPTPIAPTLSNRYAAPRSRPLIFSRAMCAACVLKRPGSCRTWTAICSQRWLKMHQPRVPARPHFAAQILRRRRVISFGHFDVAVAIHLPLRFLEEREALGRQRQQGCRSTSSKTLPTCCLVVP